MKFILKLFILSSVVFGHTTVTYSTDMAISGQLSVENDFSINAIPRTRTSELTCGEQYADKDLIVRDCTSAIVANEYDIVTSGYTGNSYVYESSSPTKGTIDNGKITWVSNGLCRFSVSREGIKKSVELYLSGIGGNYCEALGLVEGSARYAMYYDYVDHFPATVANRNIYSYWNDATSTYVRNVNIWTKDMNVDLTPIPAYQSKHYFGGDNAPYTGVLISPSTVITAWHCHTVVTIFGVGAVFRFVDSNNNVIERTVSAIEQISPETNADLMLLFFSEPVTGITPASIFPSDYLDYIPYEYDNYKTSIGVCFYSMVGAFHARDRNLNLVPVLRGIFHNFGSVNFYEAGDSTDSSLIIDTDILDWYVSSTVTGNSGSAEIGFIDGVTVAISTLGGDRNIARYSAQIQALINAHTEPDETLTYVDLSGYTNYGD